MNRTMNSVTTAGETMQFVSYEAQIASLIKQLGYVPQLSMKGLAPTPNNSMPWATVGAAKVMNVDGKHPIRVESQMEFKLHQNSLSCSDAQKMAIAMEIAKDVVEVIARLKELAGVVEVKSLSIDQPEYTAKPSEQITVGATLRIISNYWREDIDA